MPGTAMFEFAAAAATALAGDSTAPGAMQPMLAALAIISPKVLSDLATGGKAAGQQAAVADTLLCEVDAAAGQLRVNSAPHAAAAAAPAHLKSDVVLASAAPAAVTDSSATAQRRHQTPLTALQQSPGQARGISSGSTGHSLAQPQLPPAAAAGHAESFIMHPAVADSVQHLGAVHVEAGSSGVSRVPVGLAAYNCGAVGSSADRCMRHGVVQVALLCRHSGGLRHPFTGC